MFTGPSFYNIDASVFKEFHINEANYFQFRAEAFNMLNHPQFDNPSDLNFSGDPHFGADHRGAQRRTNSAAGAEVLLLGLTAKVVSCFGQQEASPGKQGMPRL